MLACVSNPPVSDTFDRVIMCEILYRSLRAGKLVVWECQMSIWFLNRSLRFLHFALGVVLFSFKTWLFLCRTSSALTRFLGYQWQTQMGGALAKYQYGGKLTLLFCVFIQLLGSVLCSSFVRCGVSFFGWLLWESFFFKFPFFSNEKEVPNSIDQNVLLSH